jgi:hypothetical protein
VSARWQSANDRASRVKASKAAITMSDFTVSAHLVFLTPITTASYAAEAFKFPGSTAAGLTLLPPPATAPILRAVTA